MARLSGVELSDTWRVDYALTRLRGVGWTLSRSMLNELSLDSKTRLKDLTAEDIAKLTAKLDEMVVEGDLVRQVRSNITRLQAISAYRGVRHSRGLPSRGQRTRSNARTKRGKRKTVGAFKKEMLAKMTQTSNQKK